MAKWTLEEIEIVKTCYKNTTWEELRKLLPMSGDNLYITPQGHRVCKTCSNLRRRIKKCNI